MERIRVEVASAVEQRRTWAKAYSETIQSVDDDVVDDDAHEEGDSSPKQCVGGSRRNLAAAAELEEEVSRRFRVCGTAKWEWVAPTSSYPRFLDWGSAVVVDSVVVAAVAVVAVGW